MITIASEIQTDLQAIEADLALYDDVNFNKRADAIDFIDFHIIDRINGLLQNNELIKLKQHAENVKRDLEKLDTNIFEQFRENIKTHTYTQLSFVREVNRHMGYDPDDITEQGKIGYDNLDIFIDKLLAIDVPADVTIDREPEMVFYQKTPARIIFEMAKRAQLKPDDVFIDIGCGLGQVTILINLISGVKTVGIEYEPAYCAYATKCATQLNLTDVKFINTDALKASYTQGTVFFMYTPFEGKMLQQMLELLKTESEKRSIRIFTYGPCSPTVAGQNWLNCINGDGNDFYILYEFRRYVSFFLI